MRLKTEIEEMPLDSFLPPSFIFRPGKVLVKLAYFCSRVARFNREQFFSIGRLIFWRKKHKKLKSNY